MAITESALLPNGANSQRESVGTGFSLIRRPENRIKNHEVTYRQGKKVQVPAQL